MRTKTNINFLKSLPASRNLHVSYSLLLWLCQGYPQLLHCIQENKDKSVINLGTDGLVHGINWSNTVALHWSAIELNKQLLRADVVWASSLPVTNYEANNNALLLFQSFPLFTCIQIFPQNPLIREQSFQKHNRKRITLINKDCDCQPWGIHVARTESLRFRLLKAVFIPITIRYFCLPIGPLNFESSDWGDPLSTDSCTALAAANSISRFEMVLSNVLGKDE